MTYSSRNASHAVRRYWWLDVEGIRKRYSTFRPSWCPTKTGSIDPMTSWWVFDEDGERLLCKTANEPDFRLNGAYSFSIIAVVRYSGMVTRYLYDKKDDNYYGWALSDNNTSAGPSFWTGRGSGKTNDLTLGSKSWTDENIMIAATNEYHTSSDCDKKIFRISSSHGTETNSINGKYQPTASGTPEVLCVGNNSSTGTYEISGKCYWLAIYRSLLSQTDLEDLYSGAKHPLDDFTPWLYISFEDPAASEYTTEDANAWVFDVGGTPTAGGTPSGDAIAGDPGSPYRYIEPWMTGPPDIGGQQADPANGSCSIPQHSVSVLDYGDEITSLVSVSDTPFAVAKLTAQMNASQTYVPVESLSGFTGFATDANDVYVDRETISYTGSSTETQTSLSAAANERSGLTAESGTTTAIYDSALTDDDGYWIGALLTVTAGTNNGETRTIDGCHYDGSLYYILSWVDPMPAACDATTVYSISSPPRAIKCTALTQVADYWTGAVLTVTAGKCAGETAWVQSFDATNDVVTVLPPLSQYPDATTTFSLTLNRLTGCTRGAYGSTANEHLVLNAHGGLNKSEVTTKVPFLATRGASIYECIDDGTEDEIIRWTGTISQVGLSHDLNSYVFEIGGVLSRLGARLLSDPATAKITQFGVWGGGLSRVDDESTSINRTRYSLVSTNAVTTDGIVIEAPREAYLDRLANSGNVKVDDEVIHYEEKKYLQWGSIYVYKLFFDTWASNQIYPDVFGIRSPVIRTQEELSKEAHYASRGLFSEKIGMDSVSASLLDPSSGDPTPVNDLQVKALLKPHDVGAIVKQALVCCGSYQSDFPRYDSLIVSGASGTFTVGHTLTSTISGATSVIIGWDSSSATLTLIDTTEDRQYQCGDTVADGGVTATVVSHVPSGRPRNNAMDVVLQLLLSTGIAGANGKYDTLPAGCGLGIPVSLVDVTAIETLRDQVFATTEVDFILAESVDAKSWLEDNIFRLIQVFPFETSSGKISLARMASWQESVMSGADATIGSDDFIVGKQPRWSIDSVPLAKISIKYNKHPTKDEYLSTTDVIFGNADQLYKGMGDSIELSFDTLYCQDRFGFTSHNNPKLPAVLRHLLNTLYDRYAIYPCPSISATTDRANVLTEIGDIALVTNANIPNMRTSLRGLSGELFQVSGKRYNANDGTVDLDLVQIGVHDKKYMRRSPSALILSVSVGADYLDLTVAPRLFSILGKNDCEYFSVGDKCTVLRNYLPPPYSATHPYEYFNASTTQEVITITSITPATNVIRTTKPTTTGVAYGFLEYATYDECTASQQSTYVFFADDDHLINSADSAYKYR